MWKVGRDHARERPRPCACAVALQRDAPVALNEEAFRHVLEIERRRAGRGRGCLVLVLVGLRRPLRRKAPLGPRIGAKLFAGLGHGVRDMDFVGWFREGTVAAAVLSPPASLASGALAGICERVTRAVSGRVPRRLRPALRVRVLRLQGVPQE